MVWLAKSISSSYDYFLIKVPLFEVIEIPTKMKYANKLRCLYHVLIKNQVS